MCIVYRYYSLLLLFFNEYIQKLPQALINLPPGAITPLSPLNASLGIPLFYFYKKFLIILMLTKLGRVALYFR